MGRHSRPKVRFALDIVFKAAELINIVLLADGHLFVRAWMAEYRVAAGNATGAADGVPLPLYNTDGMRLLSAEQSDAWIAAFGDRHYVDEHWLPSLDVTPSRTFCEVVSLVFAASRLLENVQSGLWSPFFLFLLMKLIEFCTCTLLVATVIGRAALVIAARSADVDHGYIDDWTRATQSALAFAAFFQCLLFWPVLTYHRAFGQALTTLFEMIYDSGSVMLIMVWSVAAFGIALTPLLPSAALDIFSSTPILTNFTNTSRISSSLDERRIFMHPLFHGAYAILGLLDIGLYEGYAERASNESSLAALLLVLFTFFVSVFCMNLLIAKMASR